MVARYEEAIADFDACIAMGNEPAIIHYYRSAALLKLGRKEDALASARLAVTRGYQLPAGYANQVGME
jgi:tetratricopeptide (TPR) repeat protein